MPTLFSTWLHIFEAYSHITKPTSILTSVFFAMCYITKYFLLIKKNFEFENLPVLVEDASEIIIIP